MLDFVIEAFWQGCVILLLVAFACIILSVTAAIITATIESMKKSKIKNDTLKSMIEKFDKLEKK